MSYPQIVRKDTSRLYKKYGGTLASFTTKSSASNVADTTVVTSVGDPGSNGVFFGQVTVGANLPIQIVTSINVFGMLIDDLGSEQYVLKSPIFVVVEVHDTTDVIARHVETGIAIGGSSVSDAVGILKEHLSGVYDLLVGDGRLGPEPARQKAILEKYIGQRRGKPAARNPCGRAGCRSCGPTASSPK